GRIWPSGRGMPRPWLGRRGCLREGCAPGGPGTRRACTDADHQRGCVARRGPGAVGNGGIVAYGARSPVPRLGAEHAQTLISVLLKQIQLQKP
ncbi:MAG TPA: hypothetical protein VF541_15930, partial [Longimicrobium sp.]